MKIVRIDDLGDSPTQFHPQLTVLSGVDSKVREQLVDIFNSIATGRGTSQNVTLEISGILLNADEETMGQLHLSDAMVGAISMRPAFQQLRNVAPPPIPPVEVTTVVGVPDTNRDQLRAVAEQLRDLQAQSDSYRSDIAPQAQAGVDVAVGQLDALERQHRVVTESWEQQQQVFDDRHSELTRSIRQAHNQREALNKWSDARSAGFGADILAIDVNEPVRRVTDGEAAELADTLEQLLHEVRHSSDRYVHNSSVAIDLRQQIRALELELESTITPDDPADSIATQRTQIEALRNEIFELVDHTVMSRTPWNRKRLEELRAQESDLLASLGYATYSDLIIGASSQPRTDRESSMTDELQQRLQTQRVALDEVVQAMGSADELTRYVHQMTSVLRMIEDVFERAESHNNVVGELQQQLTTHLGSPRLTAMTFDEALPNAVVGIEQIVHQLRACMVFDPAAASELHETLLNFQRQHDELLEAIEAECGAIELFDGARFHMVDGPVLDQLRAAHEWLHTLDAHIAGNETLTAKITQLSVELETLTMEHQNSEILQRWSELERQRDAILQRLITAEEQLQRHQGALAALAEIRTHELDLRAKERELISTIAPLPQSGVGQTSPDQSTTQTQHATAPPLTPQTASLVAVGHDVNAAERRQVISEWDIVRELSYRRDFSFVGSIPVLVLDAELEPNSFHGANRRGLFQRWAAMSRHVQIVMVTTDDSVTRWAYGLGTAASVVELSEHTR